MKTNVLMKFMTAMAAWMMIPALVFGQAVVETRNTEAFSQVKASGLLTVSLTQAEQYRVEVEAEEALLPLILTRVSEGTLLIQQGESNIPADEVVIRVFAPNFSRLQAEGAATLVSTNQLVGPSLYIGASGAGKLYLDVQTDALKTELDGASRAELKGRATAHDLRLAGASNAQASQLATESSKVILAGASVAHITVNETLEARASGASRLSYRGQPVNRSKQISGLSTITSLDGPAPVAEAPDRDPTEIKEKKQEIVIGDVRVQRTRRPSRAYRFRDTWTGFELGVNGYLSPNHSLDLDAEDRFMDLEYQNSIAVNLNLFQQNFPLITNRVALVAGLGISWNNYRFSNNIRLQHEPDELAHFTDSIHTFDKNKLTISHLQVPLMLEFQTPGPRRSGAFHMAAGLNVGLRLRSHTKQVYHINGNKQKDKDFNDFHLSPFRYEALARVGWGRINLFASYALNPLFRDDRGPEIYPFSVGIRVLNF